MSKPLIETLLQSGDAISKMVPAGNLLFCWGDSCDNYVIVKAGTVRVELLTAAGNQLLLYRIDSGESCVMTTSCLFSNSLYDAQATTESDVELILLPRAAFHRLIKESPDFLTFVFDSFGSRLASLVKRTTELTTQTIDQRLAAALLAQVENTDDNLTITLTHQQLSVEIGSAREVVTRRLAHFEQQALLERRRGHIVISDLDAMKRMVRFI